MDGWAFLEYVKTDDHFGTIPVVMITSLDDREHRDRAAVLGAADYHIKPVDRARLSATIAEQLSKAEA